MARVPYNPVPEALEGVGRPTAEGPRVDTPGAAFGTNIAAGMGKLGQTGEQVGNELFQRAMEIQGLRNENTARETSIAATEEMAQRYARYNNLEGQDKANDLIPLQKDLNDIRLKYRANLNPMAARMFDADAASLQNSFIRYSAITAGTAVKEAAVSTAKAHADLISNQWVNPLDDNEARSKAARIDSALRTQVENSPGGWSQEKYEDIKQQAYSKLWFDRIEIVGRTDPVRGFDMLNQARAANEIIPDQEKAINTFLMAQNRAVGGANLANMVYSPNKPLKQAEEEVAKLAPQYAYGDALFAPHAIDVLRGKYYVDRQAQNQENVSNQNLIYKGIISGQYTTVQQMRADPQLGPAIDALEESDPKFAKGLQASINAHFTAENKKTNDDNFNQLLGLTYTDPQKFLETNLMTTQLSDAQRSRLMSIRGALTKDPNGDPRVTSALRLMQSTHRGELQALGIFNKPKPDEDNPDYNRYVGALQSAIEAFTEANKRPPSPKEITEDIGPEVIRTHAEPWLGQTLWPTKVPRFNEDIPEEDMDAVRKEVMDKGNAYGEDLKPTDEEIRRVILRNQFKRLYKGTTAQEDTGGGPAPPQSR